MTIPALRLRAFAPLRLNSPSRFNPDVQPFRVFRVFRGKIHSPNQTRRETGTNRTALSIQQLTAAQKRTEPGSKANRTRIKSRKIFASVCESVLPKFENPKFRRTKRTSRLLGGGGVTDSPRSSNNLFRHRRLRTRFVKGEDNPTAE
jgi:hypothetical protein